MTSRWARGAFIFFLFTWLNIVLPGHTRGMITVPGYRAAGTESAPVESCCAPKKSAEGKRTPSPADASHCAVCQLAATLTTPTPIVLLDTSAALLPDHAIECPVSAARAPVALPFHGRAPPAA